MWGAREGAQVEGSVRVRACQPVHRVGVHARSPLIIIILILILITIPIITTIIPAFGTAKPSDPPVRINRVMHESPSK